MCHRLENYFHSSTNKKKKEKSLGMNVSTEDAFVEQNKTRLFFLPTFQITTSCNHANTSKKIKTLRFLRHPHSNTVSFLRIKALFLPEHKGRSKWETCALENTLLCRRSVSLAWAWKFRLQNKSGSWKSVRLWCIKKGDINQNPRTNAGNV